MSDGSERVPIHGPSRSVITKHKWTIDFIDFFRLRIVVRSGDYCIISRIFIRLLVTAVDPRRAASGRARGATELTRATANDASIVAVLQK
jgi:hypothetical protein